MLPLMSGCLRAATHLKQHKQAQQQYALCYSEGRTLCSLQEWLLLLLPVVWA
jgi:hypothetical protein